MPTYEGRASTVIWSMWTMTFVTLIFVCARMYTRIFIVRLVGWDDWLIVITWILNMVFSTLCTVAAMKGMGTHLADLSLDEIVITLKLVTIAQTVGIIVAGTVKLVLGAFLLRIVVKPWHRIALWLPMVVISSFCIFTVLCLWLQVTPLEALFNPTLPGKYHLNQTAVSVVYSSVLIASDFFYAAFPWLFMWDLQMRAKEKITVACGLSLGFLAGICGIVRTIKLASLATVDFSWVIVDPIIWTAGEFCITLICNSIVCLFPLYKRVILHSGEGGRGYKDQVDDGPYYPSGSHNLNHTYKSRNIAYPLTPPNQYYTRTTTATMVRPDNYSDDSILGSTKRNNLVGIKRTDEVTVEYGEDGSSRECFANK